MTHILVIEDETLLRREVTEWLTMEGYTASNAADGVQGLAQAQETLPDLIICDITMPLLDGYGVLLELRSNPATAFIPFIFVTAKATHEDIRKGMQMGADDYIVKPFSLHELLDAIVARLEKAKLSEQRYEYEFQALQNAIFHEHEQRILKTKMVAMFSHDFRNPLAVIQSSASLLRDYADRMDAARRAGHFDKIMFSVNQLTQMLNDMLMVAQLESGTIDYQPETLRLDDVIEEIVQEFQIVHHDSHNIRYESYGNCHALLDPRLLRQIATNLISNAIKYSKSGTEVVVILDCQDQDFLLIVKDQGIGITAEDQARLFQAFQRGSNVNNIAGTGLGLTILKQAVEFMRGDIQVESALGVGTTFTIMCPKT